MKLQLETFYLKFLSPPTTIYLVVTTSKRQQSFKQSLSVSRQDSNAWRWLAYIVRTVKKILANRFLFFKINLIYYYYFWLLLAVTSVLLRVAVMQWRHVRHSQVLAWPTCLSCWWGSGRLQWTQQVAVVVSPSRFSAVWEWSFPLQKVLDLIQISVRVCSRGAGKHFKALESKKR